MQFRIFSLLLLSSALATAQTFIETDQELLQMLRQNTAPGVYELAARTFVKSGTAAYGADPGRLTGTPDEPIIIRGAGMDATTIECPQVCFFSDNENVIFEDLTFRGAINSQHLKNWTFRRVRFKDVATPELNRRTFGGQAGGVIYKTAGGGAGAGPIRFENCVFDPAEISSPDTVLDFVGVQGVEILDSVFERCNRGCLQAKGASGVVEPFRIEGNLVRDAGDRGIFVGGGAGPQFFDPPIAISRHEFGSATIRNNVIVGGKACITVSTFGGPVLVENNLCYGQSTFLWRLLKENEHVDIDVSRDLTMRRNVFAGFTGENEFSFNFSNRPGHFVWDSIVFEENAFDHDPEIELYWPPVMLNSNRLGADPGIVFDDGVPRASSAELTAAGIGPNRWVGPARITSGGVVSAASFMTGPVAPRQIISIFGGGFSDEVHVAGGTPLPARLGGVEALLVDALGFRRPLEMLVVSPGQINAILPGSLTQGAGFIQVSAPGDPLTEEPVTVEPVAPGIFAANANGAGIAAAAAVRVEEDGTQTPLQVLDGSGPLTGFPIDLGDGTRPVALLLFGTGLRDFSTVRVTIGGVEADVTGVAAQGEFAGLDQINVIIPLELAGRGEVEVQVVIDDQPANVVTIVIG